MNTERKPNLTNDFNKFIDIINEDSISIKPLPDTLENRINKLDTTNLEIIKYLNDNCIKYKRKDEIESLIDNNQVKFNALLEENNELLTIKRKHKAIMESLEYLEKRRFKYERHFSYYMNDYNMQLEALNLEYDELSTIIELNEKYYKFYNNKYDKLINTFGSIICNLERKIYDHIIYYNNKSLIQGLQKRTQDIIKIIDNNKKIINRYLDQLCDTNDNYDSDDSNKSLCNNISEIKNI